MRRAHGPMWSATNARCGAKCWEWKGGQATFGLPLRRNSWSTLRGLREFDAVFLGRDAIFGVRCGVLGRDAARHVATKAVRGLCIDGHRLERNDIPDNADCRGGVFAVFAKISPPVLAAFRGYGVGVVFLGRDAVF